MIKINARLCVGCGSCVEECPSNAIKIYAEDIAILEPIKCDDCYRCIETCPSNAIRRTV